MSGPERAVPSPAAIDAMLRELRATEPDKHHCYVGDGSDLPGLVAQQRAEQAQGGGQR